jgi:uncharacterized membrane protein YqiK
VGLIMIAELVVRFRAPARSLRPAPPPQVVELKEQLAAMQAAVAAQNAEKTKAEAELQAMQAKGDARKEHAVRLNEYLKESGIARVDFSDRHRSLTASATVYMACVLIGRAASGDAEAGLERVRRGEGKHRESHAASGWGCYR